MASAPISCLGDCARAALAALKVTLMIHDRPLTMTPDLKIGYNYGLMIPWNGEDKITYEDWQAKVAKKLNVEKIRRDLYGYY